ncbi:MAG TPA: SIS domain-containing protein [Phycisphaerales bacterium]|nr:SIS domain-containing protein [Phycisphaerales bacterium]
MTPAHRALQAAHDALSRLLADQKNVGGIEVVAGAIAACFRAGGKVLACGNGGSACDAMHFCEELTGRFRADREPLPAIACIDAGHITCTANDYGYDAVFERWVRALGKPGDVLVLLSTSGNSPTVLRAAAAAKELGVTRVALLGACGLKPGGDLAGVCEHELLVPGETADRIQELHMLILHTIIECVELGLMKQSPR